MISAAIERVLVTTVEQAQALPEISGPFWDSKIVTNPVTGESRVERKARPFCPTPTDGDQILLFTDADGRQMQVVYTPDGPAKCRFWL